MADESTSSAGTRFSEDLRRIREERGLSIQDIHQNTQIAETLIESFEAARLYDHPTYNRVYLRSFIRAYADAIDISQERALDSLDAALEGTYDHALADQYLADSVDPAPSDSTSPPPEDNADLPPSDESAAPTAGGPEGRGGIVGPPRAIGEDAEEDAPSSEQSPSIPDSASSPPSSASVQDAEDTAPEDPADRSDSEEPGPGPDNDEAEGDPEPSFLPSSDTDDGPSSKAGEGEASDFQEPRPEAPEDEAIPSGAETGVVGEATALGSEDAHPPSETASSGDRSPPPAGPSSGSTSAKQSIFRDRPRIYAIGIGIAVVIAVLIGLGVAYFSTGSSSQQSTGESSPPVASDTATASEPDTTTQAGPPPANVQLGGSIHLALRAQSDVSGIRIQRDDDLRRPYWIQEGDVNVFPFQEQATIGGGLANVRVLVEGYPYPVQSQDTTAELVITRSDVEAFVDTLRGDPVSLPASPDTIAIGEPNR